MFIMKQSSPKNKRESKINFNRSFHSSFDSSLHSVLYVLLEEEEDEKAV